MKKVVGLGSSFDLVSLGHELQERFALFKVVDMGVDHGLGSFFSGWKDII